MWVKLETSYEQKSEQRLEHLYLQRLEYKMETGDSVATHVSKLQKLWMELNEESWRVDKCKLPDTLLIMRILSTLPNEYFEFRMTWESVPRSERTVEYLLERLTMVETRLSQINEATTVSTDVSALLGKKPSTVKYNNSSSLKPKRDTSKVKCYGCKEFGHFKNKCPNVKSAPSKSSASDSALFGEVLLTSVPADGIWIADSGATQHMTKSKDYFVTYTSFNTPKPVTFVNSVMMAYGEGHIEVESFVNGVCLSHTLKKVWYTPDVVKILFSVPAAADKGIIVSPTVNEVIEKQPCVF